MTDNPNHPNSGDDRREGEQAQSPQQTAPDTASEVQTTATSKDKRAPKSSAQNKKPAAAQPEIKKVDVVIAGVTYPVNCPAHEEEELRSAIYHINDFAMNLRKEAPRLSQENLLVLTCLNLYERIHHQQQQNDERAEQDKQSEALIHKIMQDAQSIL